MRSAREWGRFNVNVNCVAFGLIHTRMTSADAKDGATVKIDGRDIRVGVNPEALKSHAQRNPLGRGGTPEEAAGGGVSVLLAGVELHYRADHRGCWEFAVAVGA